MIGTKLLPSSDCIAWSYENTTSSSKLRRFLVDAFIWHAAPLPQETLATEAEFAAEVAVGLQNRVFDRSMRDPFKIAGSQSALGLEAPRSTTSDYQLRDSNGSLGRGGLFLDGAIDPQVLNQFRPIHAANTKNHGPAYGFLQRPPIHPFGSAGGVYNSLIANLPPYRPCSVVSTNQPWHGQPIRPCGYSAATEQQPSKWQLTIGRDWE